MQMMPETAREMGLDASESARKLEAGTRYLNKRNDPSNAIAAYNAGPGAVDKYHGIPRFRETPTYVARVRSLLGHSLTRMVVRISNAASTRTLRQPRPR